MNSTATATQNADHACQAAKERADAAERDCQSFLTTAPRSRARERCEAVLAFLLFGMLLYGLGASGIFIMLFTGTTWIGYVNGGISLLFRTFPERAAFALGIALLFVFSWVFKKALEHAVQRHTNFVDHLVVEQASRWRSRAAKTPACLFAGILARLERDWTRSIERRLVHAAKHRARPMRMRTWLAIRGCLLGY
jgi:hypothetical protein